MLFSWHLEQKARFGWNANSVLLVSVPARLIRWKNGILSQRMNNFDGKSVAHSLRRYRRARGLQQKEVAEILGLKDSSMISRWEKGFSLPSTLNIIKLALVYRTMIDALFLDVMRSMLEDLREKERRVLQDKTKN